MKAKVPQFEKATTKSKKATRYMTKRTTRSKKFFVIQHNPGKLFSGKRKLVLFCIVFAAVGVVVLIKTHAATPFVAFEAENGSCDPKVSKISDAAFSGGAAVQFGKTDGAACDTALTLTSLDSTIRANWKAPTTTGVKFQVASVWDGSTLVASKVVGATSTAADMNGLAYNKDYTIKVQSINSDNSLSAPITAVGRTDPELPMANAAFFENFNDCKPGDVNYNYFDIHATTKPNAPGFLSAEDKMMQFANECHFHTQIFGGTDHGGIFLRPRVAFDFANRTGTFQIEVDSPPVMVGTNSSITGNGSIGKWFELNLDEKFAEGNGDYIGPSEATSGGLNNSVTFGIFSQDETKTGTAQRYNIPVIVLNNKGVITKFTGTSSIYSPPNVRMPISIKVSQHQAQMYVNGQLAVSTSGDINLPYNKGYWVVNHRSIYSHRIAQNAFALPTLFQLLHWDTIQFDGPSGSINPVVHTYVQPNCPTTTVLEGFSYEQHCSHIKTSGGSVSLNLPTTDGDPAAAQTVHLNFIQKGSRASGLTVNGTPVTITSAPTDQFQVDVPTNLVHTGNNTFTFTGSGIDVTQVELEVITKTPRVLTTNNGLAPGPMINVTGQNLYMEKLASDPAVKTITTNLYSQGAVSPVNYTAMVESPANAPWLTISNDGGATFGTSVSGTLSSSPAVGGGGSLVPLIVRIDYSKAPTEGSFGEGAWIDQIMIHGSAGTATTMPVAVGVFGFTPTSLVESNYTGPAPIVTSYPLNGVINKCAIIDYKGPGQKAAGCP
jgi:hypothetical protein